MDTSNIPKVKQMPQVLTAPKCDKEAPLLFSLIKSNIVEFVECGENLYIASDITGNGKTSWAI